MDKNFARELALSKAPTTLGREKLEPEEFIADFCIHDDGAGNTVDDRLEIRGYTGAEGIQFAKERKTDLEKAVGNLLVKVIMLPNGSNETLFNTADFQVVLGFGNGVLGPILAKVMVMSGDTPGAVELAKNG